MEEKHINQLLPTFSDKLLMKLNSVKKIRVSDGEIKAIVDDILNVIQRVNQLGMYDCNIPEWDNRSLDDIEIPSEFSQFVLPSSVRFNAGDIRSKELLVKPKLSKLPDDLSYLRFNMSVSKLRSMMKKDFRDDLVSIGSVRKAVSLSDVIDRFYIVRNNGELRSRLMSDTNLPMELTNCIDLMFEEDYYNTRNINIIIDDFVSSMKF